jgi:methionyl-tRNA formyltransferase
VIDWKKPAIEIERMTRAFDPWPIARTSYGGIDLMIFRVRAIESRGDAAPGALIEVKPNPIVQCGEGSLELLEVQVPGKRRIAASDFARGRRLSIGERLGSS